MRKRSFIEINFENAAMEDDLKSKPGSLPLSIIAGTARWWISNLSATR